MYLKQLNRIESAINSRLGDYPAWHTVFVDGYKTKQQALLEYQDKNHTDPGDDYFYVYVYPEYCRYEHTSFSKTNDKLMSKLMDEGFTMDEIFKKYVNQG